MTPTDPRPQLRAALQAAQRGWHVFPLRPDDKRPAGHAEERCPGTGRCEHGHLTPEQRATTDLEQIRRCWEHARFGVGIATGPSRLVVIDLDTRKSEDDVPPEDWGGRQGIHDGLDVFAAVCEAAGRRMPTETRTVRTGRGGLHLYFTAPPEKRLRSGAGVLGWKVDIRAWGGYVVAPGTTVAGRAYDVVNDAAPVPLPAWLSDRLTPPPAPARMPIGVLRQRMKNADSYTHAAVDGELEKIRAAGHGAGSRNEAVYRAAYALARFTITGTLTEPELTDTLTAAGVATGLSPRECDTAIRSGLRRGTPNRGSAA
ncbi:bifunctional DNA primase/polymerase [Streptomyces triculaminicus]|uniref:bifunctional DNA primase/polymerase n=1 Tax=Streptomyces triculaminicus TaxID=2816232 RepID=UPI00379E054A